MCTRPSGCGLDWFRIEAFQAKKKGTTPFNDVLESFKVFCLVDKRLKKSTTRLHIRNLRRLLRSLNKDPQEITTQDIRTYLVQYLDKATSTYADQIKTLRVFFRDFLRCGHLVESFILPQSGYMPKIIPSKAKLQRFYWALEEPRDKALFLMFATSGLRKAEVLSLTFEDLDMENRMVFPRKHEDNRGTKRNWVRFYNTEAETALEKYSVVRKDNDHRVFLLSLNTTFKTWKNATKKTGIRIMPQILRDWFCCEMGNLGVQDRYVMPSVEEHRNRYWLDITLTIVLKG
jgi:integrase